RPKACLTFAFPSSIAATETIIARWHQATCVHANLTLLAHTHIDHRLNSTRVRVVSRTPAGPLALVAYAAALLVLAFPLRAALAGKSKVADGMPCMEIHRYDLANASHRLGCGDQNAALDESDEIAALEAIRIALSEVSDGSIYVWHRRYGHLGGLVQPSASY